MSHAATKTQDRLRQGREQRVWFGWLLSTPATPSWYMLPLFESHSKWIFWSFLLLRTSLNFLFLDERDMGFFVLMCQWLLKCCFLQPRAMMIFRKSQHKRDFSLTGTCDAQHLRLATVRSEWRLTDSFKSGHVNKHLSLRVSFMLSGCVCRKSYLFILKGSKASEF